MLAGRAGGRPNFFEYTLFALPRTASDILNVDIGCRSGRNRTT
jgi:hypothetical protein